MYYIMDDIIDLMCVVPMKKSLLFYIKFFHECKIKKNFFKICLYEYHLVYFGKYRNIFIYSIYPLLSYSTYTLLVDSFTFAVFTKYLAYARIFYYNEYITRYYLLLRNFGIRRVLLNTLHLSFKDSYRSFHKDIYLNKYGFTAIIYSSKKVINQNYLLFLQKSYLENNLFILFLPIIIIFFFFFRLYLLNHFFYLIHYFTFFSSPRMQRIRYFTFWDILQIQFLFRNKYNYMFYYFLFKTKNKLLRISGNKVPLPLAPPIAENSIESMVTLRRFWLSWVRNRHSVRPFAYLSVVYEPLIFQNYYTVALGKRNQTKFSDLFFIFRDSDIRNKYVSLNIFIFMQNYLSHILLNFWLGYFNVIYLPKIIDIGSILLNYRFSNYIIFMLKNIPFLLYEHLFHEFISPYNKIYIHKLKQWGWKRGWHTQSAAMDIPKNYSNY